MTIPLGRRRSSGSRRRSPGSAAIPSSPIWRRVCQWVGLSEYGQICDDHDATSRQFFAERYRPPEGLRFGDSPARFPDRTLRERLEVAYRRECATLFSGAYPSFEEVLGCFGRSVTCSDTVRPRRRWSPRRPRANCGTFRPPDFSGSVPGSQLLAVKLQGGARPGFLPADIGDDPHVLAGALAFHEEVALLRDHRLAFLVWRIRRRALSSWCRSRSPARRLRSLRPPARC